MIKDEINEEKLIVEIIIRVENQRDIVEMIIMAVINQRDIVEKIYELVINDYNVEGSKGTTNEDVEIEEPRDMVFNYNMDDFNYDKGDT